MAENEEELKHSDCIQVRVITPAGTERFSRGFYQVEEDCLYVPLYPSGHFYSYIDSESSPLRHSDPTKPPGSISVNLDIDREGRLLFIHVKTPQRRWTISQQIEIPSTIETADLRFISFRANHSRARISATPDFSTMMISFAESDQARFYRITDNMIAGIAGNECLSALWLLDCVEDRGAREMAAWRKRLKADAADATPDQSFTRIEIE